MDKKEFIQKLYILFCVVFLIFSIVFFINQMQLLKEITDRKVLANIDLLVDGKKTKNAVVYIDNSKPYIYLDITTLKNVKLQNIELKLISFSEKNNIRFLEDYTNKDIDKTTFNTVYLKDIDEDTQKLISIPIEFIDHDANYKNPNEIVNDVVLKLSGDTYTKENGKVKVEGFAQEQNLEVVWTDKKELAIDTSLLKFLRQEDGKDNANKNILMQFGVDVSCENKGNINIPYEYFLFKSIMPTIEGKFPTNITVTLEDTKGFNYNKNIPLEKNDIKYNQYDGTLEFVLKNVQDAGKVYVGKKDIRFLITCNYEQVENFKDSYTFKIDQSARISKLGNYLLNINQEDKMKSKKLDDQEQLDKASEDERNKLYIDGQFSQEYTIKEDFGGAYTLSYNSNSESVSKSQIKSLFLNSKKQVPLNDSIIISSSTVNDDQLNIKDLPTIFKLNDGQGNDHAFAKVIYKKVFVEKNIFDRVIGINNYITLKDDQGNIIGQINSSTKDDKYYFAKIDTDVEHINYEIYGFKNKGDLIIKEEKVIVPQDHNVASGNTIQEGDDEKSQKDKLFKFQNIIDNMQEIVLEKELVNTKNEKQDSLKVETTLPIVDSQVQIDVKTVFNKEKSLDSLSFTVYNYDLNVDLNDSKPNSDVYVDPTIEIKLPKDITDARINDVRMENSNGFSIKNYEVKTIDNTSKTENSDNQFGNQDKQQVLVINLDGIQKTKSTKEDTTLSINTNFRVSNNGSNSQYNNEKYLKVYSYNNQGNTNEEQGKNNKKLITEVKLVLPEKKSQTQIIYEKEDMYIKGILVSAIVSITLVMVFGLIMWYNKRITLI